jgi:hypothetical protein
MARSGPGRPPRYKTAEALQAKIDQYFNQLAPDAAPTIYGLVLYLGFCDRQAFYHLEKNAEFCHIIKSARSRIAISYEKALLGSKYATGAIFWLKNAGWTDKQDLNIGGQPDNKLDFKVTFE